MRDDEASKRQEEAVEPLCRCAAATGWRGAIRQDRHWLIHMEAYQHTVPSSPLTPDDDGAAGEMTVSRVPLGLE